MIIKLVWHCLLLCILFQKIVTHLWGTMLCPFSSKMGYKLGYIGKLHTFETSLFFSCLYSNKEYKIHVKRWMKLLFWEDTFIYLTSFRPKDFPGSLVVKNPPAHTGDTGSIPGWEDLRRKWQPTPIFLPGKSHEQRSLEGCRPWGGKKLDMTNAFTFRFLLVFEFVTPIIRKGNVMRAGKVICGGSLFRILILNWGFDPGLGLKGAKWRRTCQLTLNERSKDMEVGLYVRKLA